MSSQALLRRFSTSTNTARSTNIPPRVAVVGGGIAGTLCSLVLKNRGLHPVIIDQGSRGVGGRLRGGAQFIRTSNPILFPVFHMLQQNRLIEEWKGRFGMLGSSRGGFLPAEIVTNITNTPNNSMGGTISGLSPASTTNNDGTPASEDDTTRKTATDGGDFCNFVEGYSSKSSPPTFVGMPTMSDICPNICKLANIDLLQGCKVNDAEMILKEGGGWKLHYEQNNKENSHHENDSINNNNEFDALVLATHDPSLASSIIRHQILSAEIQAATLLNNNDDDDRDKTANAENHQLWNRLSDLATKLQDIRDHGYSPLYTAVVTYPEQFSDSVPFDAVSVPGSSLVQFMSRNASKPGHKGVSTRCTWTVICTSAFASEVLSKRHEWTQEQQESYVQSMITEEMAQLFRPYFTSNGSNTNDIPSPIKVTVKRWSSGICTKGLGSLENEDSIMLAPWRMAICGDFIQDLSSSDHINTPIEASALSGLQAGERIASLFAGNTEEATSPTTSGQN